MGEGGKEGGKRQLDTVRKTMTKGLQILPDTFIPLYKLLSLSESHSPPRECISYFIMHKYLLKGHL